MPAVATIPGAIAPGNGLLGVMHDGECDGCPREEPTNGGHVPVDAHADDDEALVLVLSMQPFEDGHLVAAGSAPGCPEVHEHNLVTQVRETDGVPL